MTRTITVSDTSTAYTLSVGGQKIGHAPSAKSLVEGSYDPVLYFDPKDLDMALFSASDHTTHCPYKGDASYYDLTIDGKTYPNAAWTYQNPIAAAEDIKGFLGFYPVVDVSEA